MARGAFIVIEGLDRSGKTTQTEHLTEYLTTTLGISIDRSKFPGELYKKKKRKKKSCQQNSSGDTNVTKLTKKPTRETTTNTPTLDLK